MSKRVFSKRYLVFLFLSIPLTLAVFVLFYSSYQAVKSRNKLKEDVAKIAARNVLDKLDRNFYERFGDVQAFAYNRLAIETALSDTNSTLVQNFINTMTSYYVLYDLMMICDKNGTVVAVNTRDKTGKEIHSDFLVGKNIKAEEWFATCMQPNGPEGGAWFSDFTVNEHVRNIDNDNFTGWGMAFASPIKDDAGNPIGVWYNFASWYEVTVKIRSQVESELQEDNPGSMVIITNESDEIIDATDDSLVVKKSLFSTELWDSDLIFKNKVLDLSQYEKSWSSSKGAYTYKGKNWKAYVLIPKEKFVFGHLFSSENIMLHIVVAIFLILAALLAIQFSNSISGNVNLLSNIIKRISEGELTKSEIQSDDEIGQMSIAVNKLADSLIDKVEFAKQIGKGELENDFKPVGEKDILGYSLMEMRDRLAISASEDKKRNWVTEGLAHFAALLRTDENIQKLYDKVLQGLVNYIGANQGGIFVLNQDNGSQKYLEMVACYAYERKKYLHKRVELREGLVGQAVLERDIIYLTEVPERYVTISSGLGEARPRSIIIVPLMVNDDIVGVLELAMFKALEEYKIEFLRKVSENIASVIVTSRMNLTTQKLLIESQQMTEQMRSQEEEMRQNLEELQATQDELHRKTLDQQRQLEEQQLAHEREIAKYKSSKS